jgi:hypothetical protein
MIVPMAPFSHRAGRGCDILRFHTVHRAGDGIGEDLRRCAGQRDQQVERMDALRQQHAAAVARQGAAPGLVVIALRPPVHQSRRGRDDRAQPTLLDQSPQGDADRPEPVLQHDAEFYSGALGRFHQFGGTLETDFQRLFQKHMLAGLGRTAHQVEMGVGRRQDHHGIDGPVGEDGVEIVADGQAVGVGEGLAPGLGRTVAGGDLDTVGEVGQAFRMGGDGHAETDDGNAGFRHGSVPGRSSARMTPRNSASPFSRPIHV